MMGGFWNGGVNGGGTPPEAQGAKGGGQTQNRTGDTRIFSPLLYRLSYLAPSFAALWLTNEKLDYAKFCRGRQMEK